MKPSGKHAPGFGALEILKYLGPGLLVTVGFIDPGNWASNLSAGASYGYALLWVVTLSTAMLIVLQHNAAHLGIATGLCLSEATRVHVKAPWSFAILGSVMAASVSTSLAEILGASIALNMLFAVPIKTAAILATLFILVMLFTNTYRIIEKAIVALVSIIGLSFLYELSLTHIVWKDALIGWVVPSFPKNSMPIIMSVLGAVVMPHNLFLHSEIIQTRQWNLQDEAVIEKQLRFEFLDTLFSMLIGWAINSAMIILAAAAFFSQRIEVTELNQAERLLAPLLGQHSATIFAVALLLSGIASSTTSGMAAGSIFAGMFKEPYDIKDPHSRIGILISMVAALLIIFLIADPFAGLIISQMALSVQLPITIFLQVYLTSSAKVMGKYKNSRPLFLLLMALGIIVSALNIGLLVSYF
jgi:manganese transport protein